MSRLLLTDAQWELIAEFFPTQASTGRPPVDRRNVMNGIFWILRTGSPWRDLPEEFGKWQTVWRLFDGWNQDGTLDAILSQLRSSQISNADELWCIDGTIVRAARCASGGGKKGIQRSLQTTH